MANTTEDKLKLLKKNKEDIKNAINDCLEEQQEVMPENTPLSDYDTYIKRIKPIDTRDATAEAGDILNGKTAYANGQKVTGNMPNNGAISITPTTSQQSIPAGYISGGTVNAVTSSIDNNIQPGNIKSGVRILGVDGSYSGIDTSDATAQSIDILSPKTAYVQGSKITGAIESIYDSVGSNPVIETFQNSNVLFDYNEDLGFAVSSNNGVSIYSINADKSLTLVDNIASGWSGNICDIKFAPKPFYEDNNVKLINLYVGGVVGSTGSPLIVYITCFRFDLISGRIYTDALHTSALFQQEYGRSGAIVVGSVYSGTFSIVPLTENRLVTIQQTHGKIGNSDPNHTVPSYYVKFADDNTGSTVSFSTISSIISEDMKGHGYATKDGSMYTTIAETGQVAIYAVLPDGEFITQIPVVVGNLTQGFPIALDDKILFNNKLYNSTGEVIHTYTNQIFYSDTSFKFYALNFIFEYITSSEEISIYSYDRDTFDITYLDTFIGVGISDITFGSALIQAFPVVSEKGIVSYNTNDNAYTSLVILSNVSSLVAMIRNGNRYDHLKSTNLNNSNQLLRGVSAYSNNGIINGTFDGSSIFISDPSTELTSINKGYIASMSGNYLQAKTYYDTGVIADENTEVIIKYAGMGNAYNIQGTAQTANTYLVHLFGFRYRQGSTSKRQFGFSNYAGGTFAFGNTEVNVRETGYTLCENDYSTPKTLKLNKTGIYLLNESTQAWELVKAMTFTGDPFVTDPLTLFGRLTYYTTASKYNVEGCGYIDIYSMQVYKNGVLTNDFQPKALTFVPPTFIYKPIGFYDTVTHRFLLPRSFAPFDL